MKKLFAMAMMVAMASTSFAQNPKIDKDIKAAGDYQAGVQVLNSQLSTLTAEQKAKGYNQLVETEYPAASKAQEALMLQQKADGTPIVHCISDAMKSAEFDQMENDKGKVSPKFIKKNADRLSSMRIQLVTIGQNFLNTDNDKALEYLGLYCSSAKSPVFAEQAAKEATVLPQVARIVAYIYYQKNDFKNAMEQAQIAMKDSASAADAEPIYVASLEKMMQNKQDTVNFINTIMQVNPSKYFSYAASLYSKIGDKAAALKLCDDAIAKDPQNKMAWATKGENAMNDRNYDEAISCFKKTVEIDPSFTAVWFNLGVCASQKGFDMNEQFSDKQGKISVENAAKVKEVLTEAKGYYEKVKELDPNHETITNWPMQLRMIYNALGETEKANEISKMLGDM